MEATGHCPDCFRGHIRDDIEPKGKIETIHGLPTYVARPSNGAEPKALIVYISDGFGWTFVNNRILCDIFADRCECLVYLPEFMDGHGPDPVTIMPAVDGMMAAVTGNSRTWYTLLVQMPYWTCQMLYTFAPFMWFCSPKAVKPRITKFFQAVQTNPSPVKTEKLKVGTTGYCWGGLYSLWLAKDEPQIRVVPHGAPAGSEPAPLIDCAFAAHPSMLKMPQDVEEIKLPVSIANGDDDNLMGRKNMELLVKILESKNAGHETVVLPGALHGFAVRPDPSDAKQSEYMAQAEDQAVSWFRRNLVG